MSSTTALTAKSNPNSPRRGRAQNISFSPSPTKVLQGRVQKTSSSSVAPPAKPDFGKFHVKKRSQSNIEESKEETLEKGPVILRTIDLGFDLYDDELRRFRAIGKENNKKLDEYLKEEFGMTSYEISEPFLLIWTGDTSPPDNRRPFMISDLVAVWLKAGQTYPQHIRIGKEGIGKDIAVVSQLVYNARSSIYILSNLDIKNLWSRHFPAANAVSIIQSKIIIELPEQEEDDFKALLKLMPRGMEGVEKFTFYYLNGPLRLEAKASKRFLEATAVNPDYHDYLEEYGHLRPGICLEGDLGEFTCSILLRKGKEERLVVPWHCFYKQDDDAEEVLAGAEGDNERVSNSEENAAIAAAQAKGNWNEMKTRIVKPYRVRHRDTHVGNVVERIGKTDFGLVKLFPGIKFNNEFFDGNTAKILIRGEDLQAADNFFVIDSFVSDQQGLQTIGRRYVRSEPVHPRLLKAYPFKVKPGGDIAIPGGYWTMEQAEVEDTTMQIIGATGNPNLMSNTTTVYDSICGSALLFCGRLKGEAAKKKSAKQGQVIGIMHYSNFQERYDGDNSVIQLADTLDPLIDAGWEVATRDEDAQMDG